MKAPTKTVFLGDVEALARFDFEPAEDQSWNGMTGVGHPGSPAMVAITAVQIVGSDVWISAEFLSPEWLERTEEIILEMVYEDAADAAEERYAADEEQA
jgi:hypothetical protein